MKPGQHTGAQQRVKDALESGLHLTNHKCFYELHTTELRSIIARLKRKGMNIKTYCKPNENQVHYYLFKECDKATYYYEVTSPNTYRQINGINYNTYEL